MYLCIRRSAIFVIAIFFLPVHIAFTNLLLKQTCNVLVYMYIYCQNGINLSKFSLHRMKRLRLTISFNSLLAYRYNHFVTVIVTFLSAICDGKTNPYGACTLRYTNDRILKRDGSVHTVSGGTCSSPDRCTGCNDGFYSTGPYCESKTQN